MSKRVDYSVSISHNDIEIDYNKWHNTPVFNFNGEIELEPQEGERWGETKTVQLSLDCRKYVSREKRFEIDEDVLNTVEEMHKTLLEAKRSSILEYAYNMIHEEEDMYDAISNLLDRYNLNKKDYIDLITFLLNKAHEAL